MKIQCSYSILKEFDNVPENITAHEARELVHEWAREQGFEELVSGK